MTTGTLRIREAKAYVPTHGSKGEQVLMTAKTGTNIASFVGGKRRRKKRKTKRRKRKRTKKKRRKKRTKKKRRKR